MFSAGSLAGFAEASGFFFAAIVDGVIEGTCSAAVDTALSVVEELEAQC
jgi:hypothetical protein